MRLTVADLMTHEPVVVPPECTADTAIQILSENDATELFVVDRQHRLLGIVPDYELLKAGLNGEASDATVEKLMSRSLPVFNPDSDAAEVARLFRDARFGCFPVVFAGRLVGVVTRRDVIRLMAVLRRIDAPHSSAASPKIRKPKIATERTRKRAKPTLVSPAPASKPASRSRRKVTA